jgi:hypothetical protein
MSVVPFDKEHFYLIHPQLAQANVTTYITDDTWEQLPKQTSFSYEIEGQKLAIGGWIEISKQRALVWAYVHADIKNKLAFLHKEILKTLSQLPYDRLEMEVDYDFKQGHRWAKLLGFQIETEKARYYRPDGKDATIYVRYKDGVSCNSDGSSSGCSSRKHDCVG